MKEFEEALARGGDALRKIADDSELKANLISAYNFSESLEAMASVAHPEFSAEKFASCAREVQACTFLAGIGMRRQSYAALRYVLERALSAVWLSANELRFREWVAGQDLTWTSLNCQEGGVFSPRFMQAFLPGAEQDAGLLRELTAQIYRECSEQIHGNYGTIDNELAWIGFNAEFVKSISELMGSVRHIVTVAFAIRFNEVIRGQESSKIFLIIEEECSQKQYVKDAIYD